jgi:hypothetical protein
LQKIERAAILFFPNVNCSMIRAKRTFHSSSQPAIDQVSLITLGLQTVRQLPLIC